MKAGKAPGCDPSITAEALKHGGEPVVEALHQICNAVFTRKIPPSQWIIRNIILPLPKKGNLYEMTNYRGITLMSIAAKAYNRILLNRIRPFIDPTLRHNQAGFRTGRSCTQQVFILRRVRALVCLGINIICLTVFIANLIFLKLVDKPRRSTSQLV